MRLKYAVFLIVLCFAAAGVLGNATPAFSGSVYLTGAESNWTDADKTGGDGDMCWAASSSNVLAWTGWDGGLSNEDSIFGAYKTYWDNAGSLEKWGYEWWFTGSVTDPLYAGSDSSFTGGPISGGDGYYTKAQFDNSFSIWGNGYGTADLSDAPNQIKNFIDGNYGTNLDVVRWAGGDNYVGHALTLWGYTYDDATGDVNGVWITDSNDGVDSLDWYGLDYNRYGYNQWYLTGYSASATQDYEHWINGLQGLQPVGSQGPVVPEPGTMLLLGAGLVGLAGFGRKRFKKN